MLILKCFNVLLKQNYQRHLTSKSYDHEDFGRLGAEEDNMSLEQMRDAPEVEPSSYEQSILNKRTGRKRKAPQDDEVSNCKVYIHIYINTFNERQDKSLAKKFYKTQLI